MMWKQPKWYWYMHYLEEIKRLNSSLKMQDVMFIWESEAQKQCDEYWMSMYKRMECITKVFNSYL